MQLVILKGIAYLMIVHHYFLKAQPPKEEKPMTYSNSAQDTCDTTTRNTVENTVLVMPYDEWTPLEKNIIDALWIIRGAAKHAWD